MNKKLLGLSFLIFFTTQINAFAQNNSSVNTSNSSQGVQHNSHYFLITTKPGILKGRTNELKAAFRDPGLNLFEVNETQSIIKIIAQKGTRIHDIKMILAGLNIGIKNFQEEYTNSAPAFFQNH